MTKDTVAAKVARRWEQLNTQEHLSPEQLAQFKQYAQLLVAWNKRFNITAVTDIPSIITDHFQDSLRLAKLIDVSSLKSIVDVGSGGGFPGIPLAIKYPHLHVILIEVSAKKIQFLDTVIQSLGLEDRVSIFDQDWRTFLRTTDFAVDCICARASLSPQELMRMFKPASPYKDTLLVYWASKTWEPTDAVRPFVSQEASYKVGNKSRKLVALRKQ